ncbi:hypothetical protein FDJ25_gp048 [Vibrio phage Aphrodite1]|uniref:Uncharacterized protein n=1 Tax=Vibrio phage Aphrodite1 TaxID=2070057 RepID=A0A2I7QI54_9CAUD|nr:hypothetical protein FDJ25_gp048 [Vibrio phage Aphrodite1]AUR81073.1 hypothetical protein Aphrodite1_0158 [Vibrio phage Aphrodite1]
MNEKEVLAGLVSRALHLGVGLVLEEGDHKVLLKTYEIRNKLESAGYHLEVHLERIGERYKLRTVGLVELGYSNLTLDYGLGERIDLNTFGDLDKDSLISFIGSRALDFIDLPIIHNNELILHYNVPPIKL